MDEDRARQMAQAEEALRVKQEQAKNEAEAKYRPIAEAAIGLIAEALRTKLAGLCPDVPEGWGIEAVQQAGQAVGWHSNDLPEGQRLVVQVAAPAEVAPDGVEDPALVGKATVGARFHYPDSGYGYYGAVRRPDGVVIEVEYHYTDAGARDHATKQYRTMGVDKAKVVADMLVTEAVRRVQSERLRRLTQRANDTGRTEAERLMKTYRSAIVTLTGVPMAEFISIERLYRTPERMTFKLNGTPEQIERLLKAAVAGEDK